MKKKPEKSVEIPQTEQKRYSEPVQGLELGETTAIPRCTEYDLEFVPSKTRIGSWGDEQTFKVPKKGNCP